MESELTQKEKTKLKNKNYYEKNKEMVQTKYKQRVNCRLCQKEVCRGGLTSHMDSKSCIKEQEMLKKIRKLNK
jgi:hypothetical protein